MALRRVIGGAAVAALVAMMSVWPAASAHASLLGAAADLFQGVISLPMNVLVGTVSGPPVIGTVNGVLAGTMDTLSYTARGVMGLAGAAIPSAATLAPFLPFVL